MPVFQITSELPNPTVDQGIAKHYSGQFYKWGETAWFVHSTETAQEIGKKIGIPQNRESAPQDSGRAVVMRLSPTYWGWAQTDLWEWLQSAFQKDSV